MVALCRLQTPRPGTFRCVPYTMTTHAYSPSQIKDFLRCPRAWWTKTIARAPDDSTAGGQYLVAGRMFDELVGLRAIAMPTPYDAGAVVVRSVRESRGVGLDPAQLTAMYERSLRQLRVAEQYLPAPKTASAQHKYRVPVPGMADTYITGKADLRLPGRVWDTKTTSDRGPGRGPDAHTPPRAYTSETLRDDVQAALYAWAEFQLNPHLQWCRCTWVYVSKPSGGGAPKSWVADVTFDRRDVEVWFDSVIRPAIIEMTRLSEVRGAFSVAADQDGCSMCFVKLSCSPLEGLQKERPDVMVFDLNKARRAAGAVDPVPAPPADDLVTQLAASVAGHTHVQPSGPREPGTLVPAASVAINRPKMVEEYAPSLNYPTVIDTTGTDLVVDPDESPAVAAREEMAAAIEAQALAGAVAPKARRTRRPRAGGAAPVSPTPTSASADSVYQEAEAIATSVQTLIDRLGGVLGDLDKRIATLLALRGGGS